LRQKVNVNINAYLALLAVSVLVQLYDCNGGNNQKWSWQ
jgi:hypothetical protein